MAAKELPIGACRAQDYANNMERTLHLGIVMGPGSCAWVVRDVRTAGVMAMAWAPDERVLHHPDLPTHPRQVTYVALPEWSTLVPEGALEDGMNVHHLALVHGRLPNTSVREEPVPALGAQCLFVTDGGHDRQVLERFPNARSLPLQAILVKGAQARSHHAPTLLLHRGAERSDIAIARNGELLLSASYPARAAEDVLYFSLMAMERCGLDTRITAVRSGGTHLQAADRELLDRYFMDHAPAIDPSMIQGMNGSGADRWLAAFDQFACVS